MPLRCRHATLPRVRAMIMLLLRDAMPRVHERVMIFAAMPLMRFAMPDARDAPLPSLVLPLRRYAFILYDYAVSGDASLLMLLRIHIYVMSLATMFAFS